MQTCDLESRTQEIGRDLFARARRAERTSPSDGLLDRMLMKWGMLFARPFARTPEKGANTLVWLVSSPDVSGETGGYFIDRKRAVPSPAAQDMEAARRLWEISGRQTGLVTEGG